MRRFTRSTSQLLMASPLTSVSFESYIRGYHAYEDIWTPTTGEELVVLRRKPDNMKDHLAVAVIKDGEIVGHVPLTSLAQYQHGIC